MFKKILIANRGEIAVRVIRACKELGIISASMYSEVDKYSLHTRLAEESYFIGESLPSESYLNQNKIIELAKEINADAIHPGYGFLSENASFIKKVEESGIVFIGPSSRSVEMMGSKTAARDLMKRNGVPIVPGTTEKIVSLESAKQNANEIGYPILLKASSGGGGKGMKRVYAEDELEAAYSSAQREALKAFGDDSVYIEKLIEHPKHIEVQIIADKFGNYCHLFERECSVQRRHQKVIEEAPSSFIDDKTRQRLTTAAINAAKACGYYNAGTIEFLVDSKKNFFFLEMNTRLQVEHPVTEFISGIDLVKEQIKIASGERLSFVQDDLRILGHAIECRVYAEDPENNFLPIAGTVEYHRLPSGPNIRIDRGIETGSEISRFYDPLLSKISVMEKHRSDAIKRMDIALNDYLIAGIKTNITFLKRILQNKKFQSGEYSIILIEEDFPADNSGNEKDFHNDDLENVAAIFSAYLKQQPQNHKVINVVCAANRWTDLSMNEVYVTINGREKVIRFINGEKVLVDGKEFLFDFSKENEFHYFLRLNKKTFDITKVAKDKNKIAILTEGNYFECKVQTKLEKNAETILAHSEKSHHKEDVVSPMPGMVLKIQKKENEEIVIGEPVLILEAMKMENEVTSPYSGLLKKIYVCENTPVEKGSKLFRIE